MWTAQITSVIKHPATFDITVDYYNNNVAVKTFTYTNLSSESKIKPLIKKQIDQYKKIEALDENVLLGNVDLTEATSPDPTAEELEDNDFYDHLLKLFALMNIHKLGLMDNTNAIDNQKTILKSLFKPRHIKFFNGLSVL